MAHRPHLHHSFDLDIPHIDDVHCFRADPSVADPMKKRGLRQGTRSVTQLSATQLERKRQNDREAQRAIRQRTKDHIDQLERDIAELRSSQETTARRLVAAQLQNQALQHENSLLTCRLQQARQLILMPSTSTTDHPQLNDTLSSSLPASPLDLRLLASRLQRHGSTSTLSNHSMMEHFSGIGTGIQPLQHDPDTHLDTSDSWPVSPSDYPYDVYGLQPTQQQPPHQAPSSASVATPTRAHLIGATPLIARDPQSDNAGIFHPQPSPSSLQQMPQYPPAPMQMSLIGTAYAPLHDDPHSATQYQDDQQTQEVNRFCRKPVMYFSLTHYPVA